MWAGLPAALEGRGAVALSRLVEAPIDVERAVRHPLTRAFLNHTGAGWERVCERAIERLAMV